MSIGTVSSTSNSNVSLVAQLLLSLLSGQTGSNSALSSNSIFNTTGFPDVLGANSNLGTNSIFNTGTTGTGSTGYSGLDSVNLQSLTSSSDENMMANAYSSDVTTALNTKIPAIPTA